MTSRSASVRTVALVSAVPPAPVTSGKTLVLNGLVDYFCERLGDDRVHYLLMTPDASRPPTLRCSLTPIPQATRLEQLGNVAWRSTATRRSSLQESMLRSPRSTAALSAALADIDPDLVVWDTIRLGQYVDTAPGRAWHTLYMDDLFSERYRRMLDLLDREPSAKLDALGQFADRLPPSLRPLVRQPWLQRRLLRREMTLVRLREDAQARRFDQTLLVNENEVRRLRTRSGVSSITELPPLWRGPATREPRAPSWPPEYVFLGRLDLAHNADAVRTLLRHCAPASRLRQPEARFRIIGPGADTDLVKEVDNTPNATLEGFVEDLDHIFARCTVMVAPIRMGSGVKIKLLESIARGVPVVATSEAVDGFRTGPYELPPILVEDDIRRWPAVLEHSAEPARNAAMSRAARALYESEYSPPVIKARYDRIFRVGAQGLVA